MQKFNTVRLLQVFVTCVVCLTTFATARAVEPGEVLKDAGLEQRARALSAELRCVVCQNQSIDDSDAPLAKDLRRLVRERLKAGDTDAEVKAYLVARYGTFVLLRPPFNWQTLLLWISPFLITFAAFFAVYRGLFRQSPSAGATLAGSSDAALSEDERARLDAVLADDRAPPQS